jgi:hypothetical protein
MRLSQVDVFASPSARGQVRLTGRVEYRDRTRSPEEIWFEVPDALAGDLSRTGNPWLACLLPYAVTLGEPLELVLPVDPLLYEGAVALMQVWDAWYPGERELVELQCDLLEPGTINPSAKVGAFFSGGVDSFHTVLRHEPMGGAILPIHIDELITVWGLDVPLGNPGAFARVRGNIAAVADALGKSTVTMATNLRESGWQATNWGLMGQAPALAAFALVLESRYRRVLLPSSLSYGSIRVWGTHPLVDPLLSTTRLDIRDDGAHDNRRAKIALVSGSELAMQHLRVCWMDQSDRNCGKCEKCLRTLTAFELLGKRDRCVTFPADAWSLDALASLRYRNDLDRRYMTRLSEHARAQGREDIAKAIDHAVSRYDFRVKAVRWARRLGFRKGRR